MSELINVKRRSENFRRDLLANVSMLALFGYFGASQDAAAEPVAEDQPVVWIELGGQLEQVDSAQAVFAPPFFNHALAVDRGVMTDAQRPARYAIGGESKLTFTPEASDWVLSATVRYGRSNSAKHLHHEGPQGPTQFIYYGPPKSNRVIQYTPGKRIFGDGQTDFGESHFVADFQAGKDVGLGLFGAGGNAVLSAGVRFAQFVSHGDVLLHARPQYSARKVSIPGQYQNYHIYRHTYTATLQNRRSTQAIGPSVSLDVSVPVGGNGSDMTFALDWGVNGSVLFGRQRVNAHHQTTGYYLGRFYYSVRSHYAHATDHSRTRSVTIPNVGGFAGASLRFLNAKVSVGYRADFFFGAVDNGIDTAQMENVGFYGPFATVSVGLGG